MCGRSVYLGTTLFAVRDSAAATSMSYGSILYFNYRATELLPSLKVNNFLCCGEFFRLLISGTFMCAHIAAIPPMKCLQFKKALYFFSIEDYHYYAIIFRDSYCKQDVHT